MSLHIINAHNRNELLQALRGTDIRVPARTKGRTTHHVEKYTICHLLSALAMANEITFPLSVCQQDRPDVLMHACYSRIGVEITEAIPKQFARLCALMGRKYPNYWLPAIHFPWNTPNLSANDMCQLLQKHTVSCGGWVADEPEREWSDFILRVVDEKLKTLGNPDFEKYDRNWLSIYDNLPLPNVKIPQAVTKLRLLLENRWCLDPAFDTLFVEHSFTVVKITPTTSNCLVVNNLW